jgi:hypothetical protein
MASIRGEWWELELASGWDAEAMNHCVTLFHPEGVGALQISAYQKPNKAIIEDGDLLEATNLAAEQHRHLGEQECGEFHGYQLVYSDEKTFWRRWWLAYGATFLFVTYNCDKAEMETELDAVNKMLTSLRSRGSADDDHG